MVDGQLGLGVPPEPENATSVMVVPVSGTRPVLLTTYVYETFWPTVPTVVGFAVLTRLMEAVAGGTVVVVAPGVVVDVVLVEVVGAGGAMMTIGGGVVPVTVTVALELAVTFGAAL